MASVVSAGSSNQAKTPKSDSHGVQDPTFFLSDNLQALILEKKGEIEEEFHEELGEEEAQNLFLRSMEVSPVEHNSQLFLENVDEEEDDDLGGGDVTSSRFSENHQFQISKPPKHKKTRSRRIPPEKKQHYYIPLTYYPPVWKDGALVIPEEVIREGEKKWEASIIGHFTGKRFPYEVVDKYAKFKWAPYGFQKTMIPRKDFFLFKFESKEECEKLIADGPWQIRGKDIILQLWRPCFKFEKQDKFPKAEF